MLFKFEIKKFVEINMGVKSFLTRLLNTFLMQITLFSGILAFIYLVPFYNPALSAQRCIDSEGEAVIHGDDIPSAKLEALTRAKWNAIESVSGIEIKSVVQNFRLIDEIVIKRTRGVITSFNVKKEYKTTDTYKVIANVCIEDSNLNSVFDQLTLNRSVAVYVPARKPQLKGWEFYGSYHEKRYSDQYEEASVFSEMLIGKLIDSGMVVTDVIGDNIEKAEDIERYMKSESHIAVKSLMYKTLSNILIVGKVDYTIPTGKGEDIGYTRMPFFNVSARLTYRAVAKDPISGKIVILAAGTEEAKGMAQEVTSATEKAQEALANKAANSIISKLSKYIEGISRQIDVKVVNIKELGDNFEIKDIIQNISWVSSVEEKAVGLFTVKYLENPIYLANSLSQKGFKILEYTDGLITVKYNRR